MALGASAGDVLVLIIRQAALLIGAGLALRLASSFVLTRILRSALYGVTATDPVRFGSVSLLLVVIALAGLFRSDPPSGGDGSDGSPEL
jgi:hypothetical protein